MSTMTHVNIVKLFDVCNNVPLRVVLDRIRNVSLLHKSVQAFGTCARTRTFVGLLTARTATPLFRASASAALTHNPRTAALPARSHHSRTPQR